MNDDNREPPRSEAAERAVIGTTLVASGEVLATLSDLRPDDFFLPYHRDAWTAIRTLERRGDNVNLISVQDEIAAMGIAGHFPEFRSWFLKVAGEAVPADQISGHASKIQKMATLRRLIVLCVDVSSRAYSMADPEELLSDVRSEAANLEANAAGDGAIRMCDLVDEGMAEIDRKARGDNRRVARFGIAKLDKMLFASAGKLITIGGLPGMGKTAEETCIFLANTMAGIPGLMFSLEMDRQEMFERMLSIRSHVTATRIHRGDIEYSEWKNKMQPAAKKLWEYPLWIDDRVLSAGQVVGQANRWFSKHVRGAGKDFAAVGIDYLNMVKSDEDKPDTRARELAKITARFKELGRRLRIPVFLLAQLNRDVLKRGGEPHMGDFRDSGELYEKSDIVIVPWRESVIKPQEYQAEKGKPEMAKIIVLKNKGGEVGAVPALFYRERMEYADPELESMDSRQDHHGDRT